MLFDDFLYTLSSSAEGQFTDRGSKFIGISFPINELNDYKEKIAQCKEKYPKANHYTYALRWSEDRSVFKMSDDGEPSGTAGRQILNVLLSNNVTNCMIVVVRYFGGTLLGVPGLINAYKLAAQEALKHSLIIKKELTERLEVKFEYSQMNRVMKIVKEHHLNVLERDNDSISKMVVEVPRSKYEQFKRVFDEILKGYS